MTKQEQLERIKNYVKQKLSKDQTGHGIDHINRVVDMAEKIAFTESCNRFIVISAAYLHDVVDEKLVVEQEQAYFELINFLKEIDLTTNQIAEIITILKNISFSSNLKERKELTIEGKIVQDADRLDAMGAIGIARTFYYGGHKKHLMFDPKENARANLTKEEYRKSSTIINHFYEKLLLLKNTLNTSYAKKIGEKRHLFLESFLNEFLDEMNEPRI